MQLVIQGIHSQDSRYHSTSTTTKWSERHTLISGYRIMGRLDHNFVAVAKITKLERRIFSSNIANASQLQFQTITRVQRNVHYQQRFEFGNRVIYIHLLFSKYWVEIKEIMLVRATCDEWIKLVNLMICPEAVRSVQSQLAGSKYL